MTKPIDLRSDTMTRPTPSMREAIARAEVGDDVYGEDPTVRRLEERVAELLGKEAALFVTSGTMGNQLCVAVQTQPGDEVIQDHHGHTYAFEVGALAAMSGVQTRTITTPHGLFGAAELEAALRPERYSLPRSRLVVVENTHNYGGGTVWPIARLREVASTARKHGLGVHMDGARLWNAVVASGTSAREYAEQVDTASVCLSKGLGAPVGSVLVGTRELVRRAHRLRKMWGGGMRQAGVLAAAGLYALDHHVERLADDHANARRLADGLANIPGLAVDLERVQTNMVFVQITRPDVDAAALSSRLAAARVLVGPADARSLRAVTHLDVSRADVDEAIARTARVLAER